MGERGAEAMATDDGPPMRVRPEVREALPDQIALLVAARIRAGRHPAGRRLPSVRQLADRLGVHRDTVRAGYGQLVRDGWVRVRSGSGAYVDPSLSPEGAAPAGRDPDDAVRRLLLRARADGVSAETLAATLGAWREALGRRSLLVIGPDAATARVWRAELATDLAGRGIEVRATTLDAWEARSGSTDRTDPPESDGRPAAPFLTAAPPELGVVAGRLPPCAELFGLRPGPGPKLRRYLLGLPHGSVAVVVSGSAPIRSEVARFAAVLRGGEVAVIDAAPDGAGLHRALSVARFVLVDVCCRERGLALPRRCEGRCFRHLDPATARVLEGYLRRGAGRRGGARTREEVR